MLLERKPPKDTANSYDQGSMNMGDVLVIYVHQNLTERPITFECKVNKPMDIGMWDLHLLRV